jgi:hypothetical protein
MGLAPIGTAASLAAPHARVFDHAGAYGHSRCRAHMYCLPIEQRCRLPGQTVFRGSMAGLCTPLPTLRPYPRWHRRTARGRCGSLFLHRGGLSPPTPCRFIRTRLLLPVSSPVTSAFPKVQTGRLNHKTPLNDFRAGVPTERRHAARGRDRIDRRPYRGHGRSGSRRL